MVDGRDTTDESFIWNPGEPQARKVTGEIIDSPEFATADKEEPDEETDTGMQPEGSETPSPEGELEENTNVETDAIKEEIKDAGPVPEATDVEINGDPEPVSSPNPEPGNSDTAPLV